MEKWNEIELHEDFFFEIQMLSESFSKNLQTYLEYDFDDYELWCEIWMMMKIRTELN